MVPALTGTNRMANQDIMLGGCLIPRKTMIWCNLNAMFSSPEAWLEPDRYIPARAPYQCQECHRSVSVPKTAGRLLEEKPMPQLGLGYRKHGQGRQGLVDGLAM